MSGWIKLNRSLSNHDLWNEKPFSRGQAWVDLIVLANHKDGFIRVAGQKITIKRGQCGWSQLRLSERWGWSRGKVKRFFSDLKNEYMIDTETNTRNTIITICNYSKFQESNDRDGTTDSATDDTTDGQQIEQQTDTNKNDKKEKNDKEGKEVKSELSLTQLAAKNVADYLHKKMLEEIPEAKSEKPETWIKDIERAMRIDGRTEEELIAVIDWMHSGDKFWVSNVRSGKKLRDKYLTMLGQMRRPAHINGSRLSVADHNKAAAEDAKRAILERSARNA